MYTNELKRFNENVISEVIDIKVFGESGSTVCDKMNKEYKHIKLMSVIPVKGIEGMFDVHIEIYNPDIWLAPKNPGFWPILRKSKRSHINTY